MYKQVEHVRSAMQLFIKKWGPAVPLPLEPVAEHLTKGGLSPKSSGEEKRLVGMQRNLGVDLLSAGGRAGVLLAAGSCFCRAAVILFPSTPCYRDA